PPMCRKPVGEGAKRVTIVIEESRKARRHSTSGLRTPRAARPRRSFDWRALWAAQHERAVLWTPIAAIAGAALYFTALREPPAWIGGAACAGAVALALVAAAFPARGGLARLAARALFALGVLAAAMAAGFAAGQIRTALVASPRLAGEIGPVGVEGWVA